MNPHHLALTDAHDNALMPLRALSQMIGSMAERSGATSEDIDAIWVVHQTLLDQAAEKLRLAAGGADQALAVARAA